MPTSTAATGTANADTPIAQKQRVVVLLPSTVDLARLDFLQVTDAACHALGLAVDLSDLVLTIAQTPLVTVRESAPAHECVKCAQHERLADVEKAVADVESGGASGGEDVGDASLAVEPRELGLAKDSEPTASEDAPVPTTPAVSIATPAANEETKELAGPENKPADISFDSVLSRISAQSQQPASLTAPRADSKTSNQAKSKPKANPPPKSSRSPPKPKHAPATSKPTTKPPVPPSTPPYFDSTSPTAAKTARDPASCLLFPPDQSGLLANVAKEEDERLRQMEEMDPVDVNYFLRLLQGSSPGTAAAASGSGSSTAGADVKQKSKKGSNKGVDEDLLSVASGSRTGMDVVDKLRLKFLQELGDDSDDDGGFGASDDDDLSM